ncbi:unnamed protein product [Thlaspi arvense]|uniref:carotenoid 9,10-dioxygenase n=1 Tax=Thlaspi arvense TaxID=13288 RepID=A0AAU9S2U9_THLAR|nr:unnamed protein product [Thlaspi arvense]
MWHLCIKKEDGGIFLRLKLSYVFQGLTLAKDVLKVLEDGDPQMLGMLGTDKRLAHSFIAHPKARCLPLAIHIPPYITYRVISKDGFMHDPKPITLPEPIMMHDFAIIENYVIFMDLPLYFRPKNKLIGHPI